MDIVKPECPECGSDDIRMAGEKRMTEKVDRFIGDSRYYMSAEEKVTTTEYVQMFCGDCYHNDRDRNFNPKARQEDN